MNKPNLIKIYLLLLWCGMLAGCGKDFLNRPPEDAIVDANFYKTPEQVLAGTAPLYNIVWFAYNDKSSHGIGDGRGRLPERAAGELFVGGDVALAGGSDDVLGQLRRRRDAVPTR